MISEKTRLELQGHLHVKAVYDFGTAQPSSKGPKPDAIVDTDGRADLAPFFDLLNLLVVWRDQVKDDARREYPTSYHVLAAPAGSYLLTSVGPRGR